MAEPGGRRQAARVATLGPAWRADWCRLSGNGLGNAGNNLLTGNASANTLLGRGANDVLAGGIGLDTLLGGDGADRFRFAAPSQGIDRIEDFSTIDVIEVSRAGFGNLLPLGVLDQAHFSGTGVAIGSAPQFVDVAATGALRWDADGAGAAPRSPSRC